MHGACDDVGMADFVAQYYGQFLHDVIKMWPQWLLSCFFGAAMARGGLDVASVVAQFVFSFCGVVASRFALPIMMFGV